MSDAVDRFFSSVVVGDCWWWTGSVQVRGYGRFSYRSRWVLAHRWVYEHLVGPIPPGLTIDHVCRNKLCVNPDHLEPVTAAENTVRGHIRTHCLYGHPFDENNTYVSPSSGHRRCKECEKARTARRVRGGKR